ncbi:sterol desaturase family protein [Sediminitomix flava]|uniref:Beta-carotene 3-hydroxylase n=1 Tax=Sediminitomix flava TaxID=379075 RepID=A0A315Z659_SEDFL|nr:sterol desaturase family protein [Sediminitomix flava]PWJ38460.1 beta-carotene 3-hydroxylase [Sediminitomix flava]
MTIFIYFLSTLFTFCLMEGVAWFAHKYVMHGFLWGLHEDHHRVHNNLFEKNDLFALIFAVPSALLFIFGSLEGIDFRFFMGLGILIYGICYFLVHDVLIHRRFKWFDKTTNRYFRAIRKAHKVHHKHQQKEDGECFGMLFVPLKYFKETTKKEAVWK